MIRLTLIVGAGKLGRQKYDPNATKAVTQSLSQCSFSEDRGASAVIECAGSYKLQHDTGKNLKTVVVFPLLSIGSNNKNSSNPLSSSSNTDDGLPIFEKDSVSYKVAVSSTTVFQNMLQHKCPTWSEKRTLLHDVITDEIETQMKECENQLVSGKPLSKSQEDFYNNLCVAIDEKKELVKDAMHKQVFESHDLTMDEMEFLLGHVQDRINELESSSNKAAASVGLKKAKERQKHLQTVSAFLKPKPLPQLKHHAKLAKLWKQAAPLMSLHFQRQNQSGTKLMSPADTKKLGQLDEILDKIHELEVDSQGWFESDDIFEQRLQSSRREFQSKFGASAGDKSRSKGSSSSSILSSSSSKKPAAASGGSGFISAKVPHSRGGRNNNAWMSAADKKAQAIQNKKNRMKKGDVFGAMMAASDDDDDDDSEDDNDDISDADIQEERDLALSSKISPSSTTRGSKNEMLGSNSDPKNGGKKKKKNKKGGANRTRGKGIIAADDDDKFLDAAVRKNQQDDASNKKSKKISGGNADSRTASGNMMRALTFIFTIVRDHLWPLAVAILTWIIGTLFGTSSKRKPKQKRE